MTTTVRQMLAGKAGVYVVSPDDTIFDALRLMADKNVGAVLVMKDGQPLFGAHVVAFDPATGTMVASFTLNAQGQFSIGGLSPGPHVVRVEPLDDADIDSFFSTSQTVDLDFRVMFFNRAVAVPKGGDSGEITLQVVRK
jgi:hypothetical protein